MYSCSCDNVAVSDLFLGDAPVNIRMQKREGYIIAASIPVLMS